MDGMICGHSQDLQLPTIGSVHLLELMVIAYVISTLSQEKHLIDHSMFLDKSEYEDAIEKARRIQLCGTREL